MQRAGKSDERRRTGARLQTLMAGCLAALGVSWSLWVAATRASGAVRAIGMQLGCDETRREPSGKGSNKRIWTDQAAFSCCYWTLASAPSLISISQRSSL